MEEIAFTVTTFGYIEDRSVPSPKMADIFVGKESLSKHSDVNTDGNRLYPAGDTICGRPQMGISSYHGTTFA